MTTEQQDQWMSGNGSCWDDGPQMRTPGGCDPIPPKCELRAGHLGAHRGGNAEWLRNPASFNQVAKERDEAQADLAKAREVIEQALEVRRTPNLSSAEIAYGMFRILTNYNAGVKDDD